MTSAVPGIIAWPLIAFMVSVIAARYALFNSAAFDRYLNNTLAYMLVTELLSQPAVQRLLDWAALLNVTATQQLSLAFMIPACTEFLGFTTLWSGRSEADTRKAYLRYRRVGLVCFVVFLALATGARRAHEPLEAYPGWVDLLAWAVYLAMLVVLSVQLLRMCIAELVHGATPRERRVASAGIALGLLIGFATLEALVLPFTNKLGLTNTVRIQEWFHGYNFFIEAIGASMLAAVPFVMQLLAYCGLDPVSRAWRKLQPLRASMRDAVPGSAFDVAGTVTHGRRRTKLQLHQTTVEIRDAVLQLRPYFSDISDDALGAFVAEFRIPARQRETAAHALALSCAVNNKAAGAKPKASEAAAVLASRATTLDQEIQDLLKLARWWPPAQSAATLLIPSTETAMR